jgi:glycosyltransferase involved in cell wall biosynthesis
VVAELREHALDLDVLVIEDGSTDDTSGAARAAGTAVVGMPFNLRIGGAVQADYQFALEHRYDVAVPVDGDGQHDARYIPELLACLRRNPRLDLVTGSRLLVRENGGYRSSMPRHSGIRIFAKILSIVVGPRVTDPTSGFRMVGPRVIELFARDYPHDYPEVEAVLLLHQHELEGTEVPVRMRPRTTDVSSINRGRLAIFVGLLRVRPKVEAGDQAPVTAEHSI